MNYAGRTAVVTGAASGMGRAFAEALLAKGAEVWAWDLQRDALADLEEWAKKRGFEVHAVGVDVTKPAHVDKGLADILAVRRRVEIWINNAGVGGQGSFRKQPAAAFRRVVEVNLHGVVTGTRAALAHMECMGGGVIVNMASVAGHIPSPFLTAYATTKHAVVGFTRSLREELRLECSGVRLVLVSPGFVETAMIRGDGIAFPDWLKWAVAEPHDVVRQVLDGVARGEEEIYPTWNGKLMLGLDRWLPVARRQGAKLLLSRSFKDWLLNRYTV